MIHDVLVGVSAVIGAVGTVISMYLAYLIKVRENEAIRRYDELALENLELGQRLTAALANGEKKP